MCISSTKETEEARSHFQLDSIFCADRKALLSLGSIWTHDSNLISSWNQDFVVHDDDVAAACSISGKACCRWALYYFYNNSSKSFLESYPSVGSDSVGILLGDENGKEGILYCGSLLPHSPTFSIKTSCFLLKFKKSLCVTLLPPCDLCCLKLKESITDSYYWELPHVPLLTDSFPRGKLLSLCFFLFAW